MGGGYLDGGGVLYVGGMYSGRGGGVLYVGVVQI